MKRTLRLITSVLVMSLYAVGVQAQGQYWLFHTTADNSKGNGGDKAVVGADLYKSVQKEKKFWDPVESTANNGQFDVFPYPEGERNDHLQDADDNKYYKVAETFVYYQKIDNEWTVTQNRPSANSWEIAWVENDLGNMPEWQQNGMRYAIVYSNIVGYYHTTKQNVVEWQLEEYTDGNQQYQLIELYPEGQDVNTIPAATEQGKYCTIGGTTYTKTGGRWVSDTPAIETGWDSTTGTLSVAPDETRTISELMTEFGITANDVNTIKFDGGTYDKATKTLTSSSNDYNTQATALTSGGFEVEKIVLGEYVTIENGITVLTVPNDNTTSVLGSNIDSNLLTDAEKAALKSATDLKLVGKITKSDWKALSDKAGSVPSGTTVNSLDLSAAIINDGSHGTDAFTLKDGDQFKNLTSLVLPNDPNYKIIPEGFATGTNITSITIPSQVETIGKGAFQGCTSLATLNFAEDGSLKTISESAFQRTNIGGNLVIPNSVETIGNWAFGQCMEITALTINKGTNLWKGGIGNCAFEMNSEQGQGDNNNKLANVYINEDNPEHLIPCDAHAFGYDNTNGNTNVATVKTRLHYPPNLYSYYVGDWKIELNGGRLEGQKELDRLKTVVEQGSVTIQEDNKTVTATPDARIGWQMFVSTGIPVTADTEWRTYSDIVPLRVPDNPDDVTKKVADVYIVCGYKAPADGNDAEAILYRMQPGDIIPAGTGLVIRHYVTDTNGGVLMFPHVSGEEAANLKPYRYVIENDSRKQPNTDYPTYYGIETRDYQRGGTGEAVHNYLEAINTTTPRAIYNAENDDIADPETLLMQRGKTKVTYRNFFFGNGLKLWTTYQERVDKNIAAGMTQEDAEEAANTIGRNTMIGDDFGEGDKTRGWGFFRCISDYYAISNKAFLHLPGTVENVNTNTVSMNATENDVQVQAKDMNMILIGLDETFYGQGIGGITTGIKDAQSVDQFENNSYYTLQGVKVLKPSKNGIYIQNGKKVVVK